MTCCRARGVLRTSSTTRACLLRGPDSEEAILGAAPETLGRGAATVANATRPTRLSTHRDFTLIGMSALSPSAADGCVHPVNGSTLRGRLSAKP
jgi:hypothetical protein